MLLDAASIPLEANGQEAQFIEEVFTGTDTSDFVGSVRAAVEEGMFTGVAVEFENLESEARPILPRAGASTSVPSRRWGWFGSVLGSG